MVFKFKSKTKKRRLQIEIGSNSKMFAAGIALMVLLVAGQSGTLPPLPWSGAEITEIFGHLKE